nr:MAG TPA: hypothetical protein [Caudoviricetes sp.]
MQIKRQVTSPPSPWQRGEGIKKNIMLIDILEITPNQRAPKCDCYDCITCPHFKNITLTCSHDVYIECDLDKEEDEL